MLVLELAPLLFSLQQKTNLQPWSEAEVSRTLSEPINKCFGIWQNNELIAFAVFRLAADEAELIEIGVLPEMRRQKLGERLFVYARTSFLELGVKSILLEVRESNIVAQEFYKKMKFKVVGRRPNYYQNFESAVLMRLEN